MTTRVVGGPKKWAGKRDRDGNREWTLTFLINATSQFDGPATVMQTPGLPFPDQFYVGIGGDFDLWATCKLDMNVTQLGQRDGDPTFWWTVDMVFSTKADNNRCKDIQIDNPLLRPMEISGGGQKYQEEATVDRFGNPILNSAFEMIHGPQIEFDKNRGHVRISQNYPVLDPFLCYGMLDTVNDLPLWGLPTRCVKLSGFTWNRKFYGQCILYYERVFEFDIRADTFDKLVMDEGTKALGGQGSNWSVTTGLWVPFPIPGYTPPPGGPNPNPKDSSHFTKFLDRQGNPIKGVLNGQGLPANGNLGQGAVAYAQIDDTTTKVVAVAVANGGSNYSAAPTVTFTNPDNGGATATAVVSGGKVVAINVTNGGLGYQEDNPPDVVLTTGGPGQISVQKYNQSNFLLLGIPTTLDSLS